MKTDFDIIVVGAGLVGLTTALACAESGASVAVVDKTKVASSGDGRASALSATSLKLCENLGVSLAGDLQPIQDMLVTEGVPESPWRLHFEGDGDGGDLGAVIENNTLKAALLKRVSEVSSVKILSPVAIESAVHIASGVILETDSGPLTSRLLVAADGRDSLLRRKAAITAQRFDYEASSLVTTIAHELPHDGLAWQRLISGGALAVLPLIGNQAHPNRSQIVWSSRTAGIQAAVQMNEDAFIGLLSEKMDGYLGEMKVAVKRQSYPLRLQVADGFTSVRLALVGDAAHSIHPLAGQGLNLGLHDAAALAEGVAMARQTGQDIGVASLLEYDMSRNTDTRAMGLLTHVISEASRFDGGVVGHLRRLSLSLANQSSTLKTALSKQASGHDGALPTLMR